MWGGSQRRRERRECGGCGRRNHRADSACLCFHFPPQDRQSRGRPRESERSRRRIEGLQEENEQVLTCLGSALNRTSIFPAVILPLALPKAGGEPHQWECFWVTIKRAKAFRRETGVENSPQMHFSGLKEISREGKTREQ